MARTARTLRTIALTAAAGATFTVVAAGAASAATIGDGGETYDMVNHEPYAVVMTITTQDGHTYSQNTQGLFRAKGDFEGTNTFTMKYAGEQGDIVIASGHVAFSAATGWDKPTIDMSRIVLKWTTGANGSIIAYA